MPLPAHSPGLLVPDYCLWQSYKDMYMKFYTTKRSEDFAVIREEMLHLMTDFT
jgi:hypothetical protein